MKIEGRFLNVPHDDLTDIQGGDAEKGEYYHLTEDDYRKALDLVDIADDLFTSNVKIKHNKLTEIQGGFVDEYGNMTEAYHLSNQEISKVRFLVSYYDEFMALVENQDYLHVEEILNNNAMIQHNKLAEIQGGLVDENDNVTEAYHLSELELSKVQFLVSHYDEIVDMLENQGYLHFNDE